MMQKIVPNAERVRFANTGTEAMMAAIRLARGVTGRPKLLKFEGHYHGWHDDLLVSSNVLPPAALGLRSDPVKIPDSSGLNRTALDDTIVVPGMICLRCNAPSRIIPDRSRRSSPKASWPTWA